MAYSAGFGQADNSAVSDYIAAMVAQPAIEAAATLLLLEWQKDQYEDIEAERIAYINAAVSYWCNAMNDIRRQMENAIDDVPEPAMFQPVSQSGEQLETIADNLQALEYSEQYAEQISKFHIEHDLARQIVLNPKYYEQNELTWCTIGDLLSGKTEIDSVVEILSDTADQAKLTGKIGNSCKLTARNLGISQQRLKTLGRREAREERISQAATVSSPERMGDVRAMELSPANRIAVAIQLGTLMQNSLQNAFNACARKDPYLFHQMQLDLNTTMNNMQLLAGKANLVNSFVPNYSSIFQGQVSDFSSALVGGINGSVQGGGGTVGIGGSTYGASGFGYNGYK